LDSSQSCLSLMVSLILVEQSTLPKSSQNLQSWTPLDCHNMVLDEAHHYDRAQKLQQLIDVAASRNPHFF
jgi:hypothetical protein